MGSDGRHGNSPMSEPLRRCSGRTCPALTHVTRTHPKRWLRPARRSPLPGRAGGTDRWQARRPDPPHGAPSDSIEPGRQGATRYQALAGSSSTRSDIAIREDRWIRLECRRAGPTSEDHVVRLEGDGGGWGVVLSHDFLLARSGAGAGWLVSPDVANRSCRHTR